MLPENEPGGVVYAGVRKFIAAETSGQFTYVESHGEEQTIFSRRLPSSVPTEVILKGRERDASDTRRIEAHTSFEFLHSFGGNARNLDFTHHRQLGWILCIIIGTVRTTKLAPEGIRAGIVMDSAREREHDSGVAPKDQSYLPPSNPAPEHRPVRTDMLSRILADMCDPSYSSTPAASDDQTLREFVDSSSRGYKGERLKKLVQDIFDRVRGLIQSGDGYRRMGGVLAVDELGETKVFGDSMSRLSDLIRILMDAFVFGNTVADSDGSIRRDAQMDLKTMRLASEVLGRLVTIGGVGVSDVVAEQVQSSIQWLAGPRQEYSLIAGVMVLRELAIAAPAVFNVHVRSFIEVIWNPLRDSDPKVRKAAVSALRACLVLIEKRETRYRVQWYYRLFEETQRGLSRTTSVETVHGSLLALGELLCHTGEFMLARYREACDTVLLFRGNKEIVIRRAVISLIPKLATFAPERFVRSYLRQSTQHLLSVLACSEDQGAGFVALAEMISSLARAGVVSQMKTPENFLEPIAMQIRECLVTKDRAVHHFQEALECSGVLCVSLEGDWEPYMTELLGPAVATGLSPSLVGCLQKVVESLPSLLGKVQSLLLDLLSLALTDKPFFDGILSPAELCALRDALTDSEVQGPELTRLALETLADFSLIPHKLLEFARMVLMPLLEERDPLTRRAAGLAVCQIVQRHAHYGHTDAPAFTMAEKRSIDSIVLRLLSLSVIDPSARVRVAIFDSLASSTSLDPHIGQPESLRNLFIAFNDEVPLVRSLAIRLAGRLLSVNPAYISPALRKYMLQLIIDLDKSPDAHQREEGANLLCVLIRAAPRLVQPYTLVILRALLSILSDVSKRRQQSKGVPVLPSGTLADSMANVPLVGVDVEDSSEDGLHIAVLDTLGELSAVSGVELNSKVPEMLPLVIGALADGGSSSTKKLVATRTLGRIVESTGSVVKPYLDYPQLLVILLTMLGNASSAGRREIVRTLGILGALDPHVHKLNLAELHGEGRLEREGVRPQYSDRAPMARTDPVSGLSVAEGLNDLFPSGAPATSSEEYYPAVAINALMRLLRDPSSAILHSRAVQALFKIIRSMGLGFVPFLPTVVPVLLSITIRADDVNRRIEMIRALADLVVFMRQHIRKFLADILSLIDMFWEEESTPVTPHILFLLTELAFTLREDLRGHMSNLLPKFISLLDEADKTGDYSLVGAALKTLCALGTVLEGSLTLLLPSIFQVLGAKGDSEAPLTVKMDIMSSLQAMLPTMQLGSHASAILHPLIRIMNGPSEELRVRALDIICCISLAIGDDIRVFIPPIRKAMLDNHIVHGTFDKILERLSIQDPPCISDAEDWESSPAFLGPENLDNNLVIKYSKLNLEQALTGAPPASDEVSGGVHSETGMLALRRAWESSQRSTRDDWAEWMRNFSIELLKQSPSRALRACSSLAQANPGMARELFAAAFVSCWSELDTGMQSQLVRSLEAALASATIPPDIVTTLLNLAEFMEHDEKALPLDTRTLGALAEKCHAYAKALHYKELEFQATPHSAVEALISINNQLRQPDAAVGVLDLAQNKLSMTLKESWYEKLQRWDDALKSYQLKVQNTKPGSQPHAEALLGQCRCLAALAEWDTLFKLCRSEWSRVEPPARRSMAPVAAHAAWQLGDWGQMKHYVNFMSTSNGGGAEGAFLSAVLDVHTGNLESAAESTERARELLGADMSALVGESYERAYADMVRVQQLTELEEILVVKTAERATASDSEFSREVREHTQGIWRGRLVGVQQNVEVYQAILSVRSLMMGMEEDVNTWLRFSGLCRSGGRMKQSKRVLQDLLDAVRSQAKKDNLAFLSPQNREIDVLYVWCKHVWADGLRQEAFGRLKQLSEDLRQWATSVQDEDMSIVSDTSEAERMLLCGRAHLKSAVWRRSLAGQLSEPLISSILSTMSYAKDCAPNWSKAWHQWAYFNVEAMVYYNNAGKHEEGSTFVAPAVTGFFKSIELSQDKAQSKLVGDKVSYNLQDILRLLTLWFGYGDAEDVEAALREGFGHVRVDTWLAVIPQIIARIHTNSETVRDMIQSLLIRIGRHHPQALMYPLLVASKSQSPSRRAAAMAVVEGVRQHSATLVEQAQMVGGELIRMAILWHEMWHEALEEASRLYFGESNVEGMLNTLLPLHDMMRKQGPTTLKEIAFVQAYGRELDEAYEWCLKYQISRKEAELHQAWDLYYHVFKRINKQLPSLTTLDVQYVAPALVKAENLELAVPGTYIVGEPLVTIASFAPQLTVITSKQRPRKLSIFGSDGAEYVFLLKGHEDLRQDERVMQLFGLINSMLATDRETSERELSIARYAVIPLSPNSGLIGWVPNTDTLHGLIREYRDARKIPLNVEHRLMLTMAPDFDHLTIIQKVEVFEHALDSTSGDDLNKVMWLKSRSSEMWLVKRTNYTRSTAVMSMAGYILGLGDRHPSNLMLDRYSGKMLHIDFGDCFEASMMRDKFPEKVPFRLTRMMVRAMEVAGIEGNFRATCDEVMRVMRDQRDSMMAMLEAFVHDPLINWRLLNADNAGDGATGEGSGGDASDMPPIDAGAAASVPRQAYTREQVLDALGVQGTDPSEALNDRAVQVMKRISDKLTGRDGLPAQDGGYVESDSVKRQVRRLIKQATSHENLCQSYIGWCPWW